MLRNLTLLSLFAGFCLIGCSGDESAADPNAGKGEVKAGAGDAKAAPMPNDTGP